MDQNTYTRGERNVRTLSQNARHGAGQHIACTCGGHSGIAPLTQSGNPVRRADQSSRALEHNGAVITLDKMFQRGQAVVLNVIGFDTQQPARLSGVRRQNPIVARTSARLGDEIQGVSVDDKRFSGLQHGAQRLTSPLRAPQSGTNGYDIRTFNRLVKLEMEGSLG